MQSTMPADPRTRVLKKAHEAILYTALGGRDTKLVRLCHDVAVYNGQMFDNVYHTEWFLNAVADAMETGDDRLNVLWFVVSSLTTRSFWKLFLASYTMVMMMAWRAHMRDTIFKESISSLRKH